MKKFFMDFIEDESGATAIEYALIAAAMCTMIIAAMSALGTDIAAIFTGISSVLKGAIPDAS